MSLINREINLILIWSAKRDITISIGKYTFGRADAKRYVWL